MRWRCNYEGKWGKAEIYRRAPVKGRAKMYLWICILFITKTKEGSGRALQNTLIMKGAMQGAKSFACDWLHMNGTTVILLRYNELKSMPHKEDSWGCYIYCAAFLTFVHFRQPTFFFTNLPSRIFFLSVWLSFLNYGGKLGLLRNSYQTLLYQKLLNGGHLWTHCLDVPVIVFHQKEWVKKLVVCLASACIIDKVVFLV